MLACLSLPAKDVTSAWFDEGKFFEESASQRMTNGFGGRLDFTADPNFVFTWRTNWNSISSIKRLEPVYIVLFVAGSPNLKSQDIVYDITIKFPDGSVCSHFTNQPAVKPPLTTATAGQDAKPSLWLSRRSTVFQTDPPDPLGTYTVEVELRDRLRQTSVKLTKQLNVIK
jgi:hypothetical protein